MSCGRSVEVASAKGRIVSAKCPGVLSSCFVPSRMWSLCEAGDTTRPSHSLPAIHVHTRLFTYLTGAWTCVSDFLSTPRRLTSIIIICTLTSGPRAPHPHHPPQTAPQPRPARDSASASASSDNHLAWSRLPLRKSLHLHIFILSNVQLASPRLHSPHADGKTF